MDEKSCVSKAGKRVLLVRRVLSIGFVLGFTAVPAGFAVSLLSVTLGTGLATTGFAVLAVLLIASYVGIPFVRCPACDKPFFVHEGMAGLLSRVNPFQQRCIHCWKALGEK